MTPPRFARAILRRAAPASVRAPLIDDLDDAFVRVAVERGEGAARRWYRRQAITGLVPALAMRWQLRRRRRFSFIRWIDSIAQDVRDGARSLRRSPAFAATAICVLALGIGANAAIFSVVNAVLLRPLPVRAPEELMYFYTPLPSGQLASGSDRDLEFLQSRREALVDVAAHFQFLPTLTADGDTERVIGEAVTVNYFDFLGVAPSLGRTFLPADGAAGTTEYSMVISHEMWLRRFGRDPAVLGKHVRLDGRTFSIVGVAAEGFFGVADPWKPSRFWVTVAQLSGERRWRWGISIMGRRRTDQTFEHARTILDVQTRQYREDLFKQIPHPATMPIYPAYTQPFVLMRASDVRTPFDPRAQAIPARFAFAAAVIVAALLALAAANIAGIMMARGVARARDLAARRALGATNGRIIQQLTIESLMLSICAGALGALMANAALVLYRVYTPARLTVIDVRVDSVVLMFSALICIVVALLVGIAPALQGLRIDIASVLGSGSASMTIARRRLRHAIVIPQVAIALMLLVGAGVHVHALQSVELADRGYAIQNRVRVSAGRWRPGGQFFTAAQPTKAETAADAERSRAFTRNLIEGFGGLHSADAAALVSRLPLDRADLSTYISKSSEAPIDAIETFASPQYFGVMNIRRRAGRDFEHGDVLQSKPVAIVSEKFAGSMWPGRDPIGQSVGAAKPRNGDGTIDWLEVVGVVDDVRPVLSDGPSPPAIYLAVAQQWYPTASSIVAHANDTALGILEIRRMIAGADPLAESTDARTLSQIAGEMLYPRRTVAAILAAAGIVGLALACIGIYGVVSYSVAQRSKEIGIRVTLGADRRSVAALVLREAALVSGAGAVIGLVASVLALRATASLVGPVPANDAAVLVGIPVTGVLVVLAACARPIARACRVDPIDVLRRF